MSPSALVARRMGSLLSFGALAAVALPLGVFTVMAATALHTNLFDLVYLR